VKNPDTAEAAIALIVSDTDANWRQKKRLRRRAHYIEQNQAGENCLGLDALTSLLGNKETERASKLILSCY